jgi:hypothetical protein
LEEVVGGVFNPACGLKRTCVIVWAYFNQNTSHVLAYLQQLLRHGGLVLVLFPLTLNAVYRLGEKRSAQRTLSIRRNTHDGEAIYTFSMGVLIN